MVRVEPDDTDADTPPRARELLDLFDRPRGELGVAQDQRVHGIRSLRASIHGFVLLETSGQFQFSDDVEESFRWSVERGAFDSRSGFRLAEHYGSPTPAACPARVTP